MPNSAFISSRRHFLSLGAAVMAGAASSCLASTTSSPLYAKLPRWRGFNLLEKFSVANDQKYIERDFAFMQLHGFNFARLPLDYRIWTDSNGKIREPPLREIDEAVSFGRKYHIHICVNLHRAPGYCVNPPMEPLDLWGDDGVAQRQFVMQWHMFAERYRDVPAEVLSFNLVNEPPNLTEEEYLRTIAPAVEAIHRQNAERLVIADGRSNGTLPTPALSSLKIAQAGRGYSPFRLTHYKAPWLGGSDQFSEPTWPMVITGEGHYDKARIWRETAEPWTRLMNTGIGAMIGEWGCFNRTPHHVALAWIKDCLDIWKQADMGWCLWNLRGAFGPLDSQRSDVAYEMRDGLHVDSEMLSLLKSDA